MTATAPLAANRVFSRAVRSGLLAGLGFLVLATSIGWFIAETPGLIGAAVGASIALLLTLITPASILLVNRFAADDLYSVLFFVVVLGGWLLKFFVLLILLVLLRDATWLNSTVMLVTLMAGIVLSLVLDVMVMLTSRMANVPDVQLPKAPGQDS